jgi:hypothetical protein
MTPRWCSTSTSWARCTLRPEAIPITIFDLGLDRATEVRTLRAFSKLLWLQNDLINRHYARNAVEDEEIVAA